MKILSPVKRQLWKRLGLLVSPKSGMPNWITHASHPTPLSRSDDLLTIFFSVRDAQNRSSAMCVDFFLSGEKFTRVSDVRGPLLSHGPANAFDSHGVTVGSALEFQNCIRLYYLGWHLGRNAPFSNFIGYAESDRIDGPYVKRASAPILGCSPENPHTVSYPFVMRTSAGFRMWFGSHLSWGENGGMTHVIKSAFSSDGIEWAAASSVAVNIDLALSPNEFAIARPSIICEGGILKMWYCKRSPLYSVGYAYSLDFGNTWCRRDDLISLTGEQQFWERSEVSYPFVFDHKGTKYMLYNGDYYGKYGFGLAILT